jgi:hypothetical protein
MMKKYLLLLILLVPTFLWGQVSIENPVKCGATSFAIIVDAQTFSHCKEALFNYKNAVEQDGLGTYMLHADWKDPMQIRTELIKLYKKDKHLEGIVLVGDVPVAMVRNAQHMTAAFKMDEKKYPFEESSVPSDRFYDDLHLTFDFIKQDPKIPSYFYYKLREDSPQTLNPTYYSARIKYPEDKGGNKYAAISKFLNKAAKAKSEVNNQLDNVVSYTGCSYNSECLITWMDEEKAYRENFPLAWKDNTRFKHYNFRMDEKMKSRLLDELQRPEVDLFMFHEHGMPEMQLLNNEAIGKTFESRYSLIRQSIYGKVRAGVGKGQSLDSLKKVYEKKYNLLPSFFDKLNDKELMKQDSIQDAYSVMAPEDLDNMKTNPKMVMLDACYNGSFQLKKYIAGYYIFNDGNTLAVQANTRNVLQDRWTLEMIGLMSQGVRAGQYNRLMVTLEGHLIGDPTLHFAPIEKNSNLSVNMTLNANKKAYWEQLLNSKYADVRSLAMRMLCDGWGNDKGMSAKLLNIYKTSKQNVVRMEAIKLLSRYRNDDFTEAVRLGLHDTYELIPRECAIYTGRMGNESLLYSMLDAYINEGERQRVAYILQSNLNMFPQQSVIAEMKKVIKASCRFHDDAPALTKYFESVQKDLDKDFAVIMDKTAPQGSRIMKIRVIRNYPYHYRLDDLFKLLNDPLEQNEIRVNIAEALGWFNLSYRRNDIVNECNTLLKDKSISQELRDELVQTVNRVK